jgi:hypothetical protein
MASVVVSVVSAVSVVVLSLCLTLSASAKCTLFCPPSLSLPWPSLRPSDRRRVAPFNAGMRELLKEEEKRTEEEREENGEKEMCERRTITHLSLSLFFLFSLCFRSSRSFQNLMVINSAQNYRINRKKPKDNKRL